MPKTKEIFEKISFEEQREIAIDLIQYHGVFYKFWDLVRPTYTNSKKYQTACVVFNKDNDCIDFIINKKFWSKLSNVQKNFIICHECLHVMLEHGERACSLLSRLNPELTNACLDIPINEMLVKYFGFSRKEVDPRSRFCWSNTVFKKENLPTDQSFEFYFNKIKDNKDIPKITMSGMGSGDSDDGGIETGSHDNLKSFNGEDASKKIQDLLDELSEEELASLKDISERIDRAQNNKGKNGNNSGGKVAGSKSGSFSKVIGKMKPKPKKKWESVIRKWSMRFSKNEKEENHWLVKSRRNNLISTDFFIPSEIECEIKKTDNDKIDVWMFLDTSGSCEALAPRFWRAAKSLPKDKFNVHYYCFDTRVYKLSEQDINKGKLYGFGGTSFRILEQYIQQSIKKEKKKYPAAVFVLTDGFGDMVKPQDEKKWYWFLSERYLALIPKRSHTFMLDEFE
jgi:predicted metal-dependent peptidase